jgi:hypothetical protein
MVACPQLGQRNHSPSAGAFISFKFLIFDTIRATDGVGAIGSDAFTLLMRALHFWWTGRPWSLVTVASRVGGGLDKCRRRGCGAVSSFSVASALALASGCFFQYRGLCPSGLCIVSFAPSSTATPRHSSQSALSPYSSGRVDSLDLRRSIVLIISCQWSHRCAKISATLDR